MAGFGTCAEKLMLVFPSSGSLFIGPATATRSRVSALTALPVFSAKCNGSSRGVGGSDQSCYDSALSIIKNATVLPALVVLDLDYTIWPFYCQYRGLRDGPPELFPETKEIIKALTSSKVPLAIASRTPAYKTAVDLLNELSVTDCFSEMEIYFTLYAKTKHFAALQRKTGIQYSSMLFFDDEARNIYEGAKLGVNSVLVSEGLDIKSLAQGLHMLEPRH